MRASEETVVVLGATNRPERYAHRALRDLLAHGHRVIPVHPRIEEIEGIAVSPALDAIQEPVDTVTVYVNPVILAPMEADLIALHPRRVIFNPGTESESLMAALSAHGIEVEVACTLVLLATGQF